MIFNVRISHPSGRINNPDYVVEALRRYGLIRPSVRYNHGEQVCHVPDVEYKGKGMGCFAPQYEVSFSFKAVWIGSDFERGRPFAQRLPQKDNWKEKSLYEYEILVDCKEEINWGANL